MFGERCALCGAPNADGYCTDSVCPFSRDLPRLVDFLAPRIVVLSPIPNLQRSLKDQL